MGTIIIKKKATAVAPAAKAPAKKVLAAPKKLKLDMASFLKPETKAKLDALRTKVHRLVVLQLLVNAHKPIKKEYDDLRKSVLSELEPDHKPGDTILFGVDNGKAQWGPMSDERKVTDMKGLHGMLGDKVFYSLCSVALGKIDDYLTDAQKSKVLSKTQTGSRTFNVFPADTE